MDRDYPLFATIVSAGSLAAAGRALGLSPAMVSKRLARLEARLGVRLVHRTTRRLALTGAGARFHDDVVAILAAVEAAETRVSGQGGTVAGPLRISAPTSFGRLHLAPHLKAFIERYPHVALELDLSDAFVDLPAGRIDLAVRIAATIEPGLTAHRLATSHRVLCAARAYLDAHGTPATIADLASHRLLAATGQLPWALSGPDGPAPVDGVSHVRTNSSEVVRELALAGVGVALRSLWDVGDDLSVGRLVHILTDHRGSADVGIYAVHPESRYAAPAVQAAIAFLADLYAHPAPWERYGLSPRSRPAP